jgi:hypothetical protein
MKITGLARFLKSVFRVFAILKDGKCGSATEAAECRTIATACHLHKRVAIHPIQRTLAACIAHDHLTFHGRLFLCPCEHDFLSPDPFPPVLADGPAGVSAGWPAQTSEEEQAADHLSECDFSGGFGSSFRIAGKSHLIPLSSNQTGHRCDRAAARHHEILHTPLVIGRKAVFRCTEWQHTGCDDIVSR